MMKNLLIFPIIYLFLLSCAKKNNEPFLNSVINMDTNPKTYLALQDSYTIGTFVEVNETFPAQTVNMMRELKKNIADPDIIATTPVGQLKT